MAIGLDSQGIYTIGQSEYQQVRDVWASTGNPGSMAQFLWEMLTQGGRAIAGPNDQGYSAYPQIVADLAAHGIDVTKWGLPTAEQIQAAPQNYPGVTPGLMPQASPGPTAPTAPPDTAPAVDGSQPAPAGPTQTTNQDQLAAFRSVKSFLDSVGFSNLATLGPDGTPGGWLWDQVVKKGYTTADEIQSALDQNADWVKRFQVHYDQLNQVASGQPTQVMSVAQIRDYEVQAANLMRAYNMPTNLYDNYTDFQNLMRQGVQITSLNKAIGTSWNRVANAAPAVRQAFADLYGPNGDQLLASYFLDNAQFESKLDLMSRAATIKGVGSELGMNLGKSISESLGQIGYEGDTARTGLLDVAAEKPLFDESVTESKDLTAETGVAAKFGTQGGDVAANDLRNRAQTRAAALSGGGGGILGQQGLLSGRTGV